MIYKPPKQDRRKFPCRNCITLAICKGEVAELQEYHTMAYFIMRKMAVSCKLLYDYLKMPDVPDATGCSNIMDSRCQYALRYFKQRTKLNQEQSSDKHKGKCIPSFLLFIKREWQKPHE